MRPDAPDTADWFRLNPDDAAALDALVEAEFEVESVPSHLRDRARAVARVLGMLEAPPADLSPDLIDRTVGLVASASSRGRHNPDEPTLCPADEDALEAWVMSGGRPSSVSGSLRERARRHDALARLVTETPLSQEGRTVDELVASTLDRIGQVEMVERDRMHIGSHRRLRLTDVLSVAAVMLLGVSIAFPIFGTVREGARRTVCDANLGRVASALGIYAGANNDALPMQTAGFGGGSWLRVGEDPRQSNSANLYVLVRDRYTDLADLACPGNPNAPTREIRRDAHDWRQIEEVSYSYQVPGGRQPRVWHADDRMPAIADRSPVTLRIIRGEPIQPEANSPNHGFRGQHIIWTDSSVSWADSPLLENGDNIWLPRSIEHAVNEARRYYGMEGNEVPDSPNDALLGP